MEKTKRLSSLSVGESGSISVLECDGTVRRRMLDLGLAEGTKVVCTGRSPLGDPSAYLVRDKIIAIRKRDAKDIRLR